MTTKYCTASSTVSKNISYPTLVSKAAEYHVAEDTDDYTPNREIENIPEALKRYELRAMRTATMGQIGRLYELSRLLENSEATDWTTEELTACALEIHKTATEIQHITYEMVGPYINQPDETEEEAGGIPD